MFNNASSFNRYIGKWGIKNVTNMNHMFKGATAFSNHDLSSWDISSVTTHTDFDDGWGAGNTSPF
jgi:surface protein